MLPLLYLFPGLSTARADVRKQAEAIFKEAVRPDDKGSMRHLNFALATDSWKEIYDFCKEKEDFEYLTSDKEEQFYYAVVEYNFPPPTSYMVTCYSGEGGDEYSITFTDTNKELVQAIRELCMAYFDEHLKRATGTQPYQYKLGNYTISVRDLRQNREDGSWIFVLYSNRY